MRVNDLDRERLVAVCAAWQRHQQTGVLLFGFDGLAVHVSRPELRAVRQGETLELFIVIFDHERRLREHLARFGEHRGQLRAVGDGIEHGRFLEACHIHDELIQVAGAIAIREQHGARNQRAVRPGQFILVNPLERFGRPGLAQLQARGAGDGHTAGLAFDFERVNAAERQRRFARVELFVVSDHERVAAPGLVLEADAPKDIICVTRGASRIGRRPHSLLAANVRAGELDIFPARRQLHLELLHALVDDDVTNRRAAADQTVADGHQIENVGNDAGREFFGREFQRPIRLVRNVSERLVGAIGEIRDGNLA